VQPLVYKELLLAIGDLNHSLLIIKKCNL